MFYCAAQPALPSLILSINVWQETIMYENDYVHTWEYHVLVNFLLVAEMAQREQ